MKRFLYSTGCSALTFLLIAAVLPGICPAAGSKRNAPSANTAILTWEAPAKNTDGTAISGLAGYNIYYDTVSKGYVKKAPKIKVRLEDRGLSCNKIEDSKDPQKQEKHDKQDGQKKRDKHPKKEKTECTYTISDLGPGTHYFAVTAYTQSGSESCFSNEVKK